MPVSIDTTKAVVAEAAHRCGRELRERRVGDARRPADGRGGGGRRGAGVPDAHAGRARARCRTTRATTTWCAEVAAFLAERVEAAKAAGIADEAICVDPGIGFGKTGEHNLSLLRHLDAIVAVGPPVVVGVSRKRFLGSIIGDADRDPGRRHGGRERRGGAARGVDGAGARRARDARGAGGRGRDRGGAVRSARDRDPRPAGVRLPRRARARSAGTGRRSCSTSGSSCTPSRADETDELADAVNYAAVCDRVVELAQGGPYRLLERLAALIADDLVAGFGVTQCAGASREARRPDPARRSDEVAVIAEASADREFRRITEACRRCASGRRRPAVVSPWPRRRARGGRAHGRRCGLERAARRWTWPRGRSPTWSLADLRLADGSGIDLVRRLAEHGGVRRAWS